MLPNDFQFSQASLQDFEVCRRRFKLRYLDRLSWPGVEAQPIREVERLAQLGIDFHRLVQQHLIGLDVNTLEQSLTEAEPELKAWWQNYIRFRPTELDAAILHPELTLSTPMAGYRLTARFDLLAVKPDGGMLIIDWKTAQRKPHRDTLATRIQTRVYRYALATAGAAFNPTQPGQAIPPENIRMLYWYPEFPDEPEAFPYDADALAQDAAFLTDLVRQVIAETEFALVADDKPCRHCTYRSYCARGPHAAPIQTLPEEPQETIDVLSLDWDQIAEIQF